MTQDVAINNNTAVVLDGMHGGGTQYVQADGTFNSNTLNIDASYDAGTTWTNLVQLMAGGFRNFDLPPNSKIRAQVPSGSGHTLKVLFR